MHRCSRSRPKGFKLNLYGWTACNSTDDASLNLSDAGSQLAALSVALPTLTVGEQPSELKVGAFREGALVDG